MRAPSLLHKALAALLWTTSVSAGRIGRTVGTSTRQISTATVFEGNGTVQATLPSGDFVNVYLHGATVTSWKDGRGDEKLFLSTASPLNGSAAIRGGIPCVFPNFGSAPENHQTSDLPSHGFARNSTWTFAGSEKSEEGVKLTFTLSSSQLIAKYQKAWPYSAEMTYTVTLTPDNLDVHFTVENVGKDAIDFQFLLHTYLSVPDINTTTVEGLKGGVYQDKLLNYTVFTETADQLSITGETDRIYTPKSVDTPIVLNDDGKARVTVLRESTLPDVTIWNTWAVKILKTADFAPKDAWKYYLAVEPGSVVNWTSLAPGSKWEGGVLYIAEHAY
ncbi:unnamed protein product [Discula destructiva]